MMMERTLTPSHAGSSRPPEPRAMRSGCPLFHLPAQSIMRTFFKRR